MTMPMSLMPGGGHVLDDVEQDRLVRDRHELLGARVGDRAQPRACAARQDQALHPIEKIARSGGAPVSPMCDVVTCHLGVEAHDGSLRARRRLRPLRGGADHAVVPRRRHLLDRGVRDLRGPDGRVAQPRHRAARRSARAHARRSSPVVVAENFTFEHYVDDNMRNIPDHYHAHGRPRAASSATA